jgi:hypothetical protein
LRLSLILGYRMHEGYLSYIVEKIMLIIRGIALAQHHVVIYKTTIRYHYDISSLLDKEV